MCVASISTRDQGSRPNVHVMITCSLQATTPWLSTSQQTSAGDLHTVLCLLSVSATFDWLQTSQGTWQPAGYQPQGYAQLQPPQDHQNGPQNTPSSTQQGCASVMLLIFKEVKYLMHNKQVINFLKDKLMQMNSSTPLKA